jgi:hypothetical protein
MRTMLRGKFSLLFTVFGLLLAIPAVALAAELNVAEVDTDTTATKVVVQQGQSANFNLLLTASGALDCTITSSAPSTAKIHTSYNVSNAGSVSSSTFSAAKDFYSNGVPQGMGGNCGVAWTGSPTAISVPATVTAGASTATGTYTYNLSAPNGQTQITNPSVSGGKLSDAVVFPLSIEVVAPSNTAPSTPGKPELASGFNTPNQGVFDLTWTASTDDGKPNPPAAVTYRLEHQDANDAAYSLVSGAGTLSTNSFSFPSASKEAEGTWTYQVKASDSLLSSAFSAASNAIKVDQSAPSAPVATTTPGSPVFDGWFKDTVTVGYNGSNDPALLDTSAGSGVPSSGYSAAQNFTTSGTHNYSGTATDNAGNVSDPVTGSVKVDADNPTFGNCPSAGPFLVNSGSHSVGPITASDGESGIDSANSTLSGSVDSSSTGTKTVTFTAKDNVGHSDTKNCDYTVRAYDFVGFSSPVDNPTVLNTVKAGQAVPLKWRLMDGTNPVTNLQSVTVNASAFTCSLGTSTDLLEEVASGSSGLQNLGNGYYQYNWKTPTSYAKSCKTLQINGEGMQLTAAQQPLFQFTK